MPLSKQDREVLRLQQWAMRCADKANRMVPERGSHLGNLTDFALEYQVRPRTWEAAYAHVLAELRARGVQ